LQSDLRAAYEKCLAKEIEQAPWKNWRSQPKTAATPEVTTATPAETAPPQVKATMTAETAPPQVKAAMPVASMAYVAPEVPVLGFCFEAPVSAPSAGMGEPEPLQPQQWNGVVEAECLEPQEPQQWTGVVDAAPMPGKFGGPNTFAHLVPGPELTGAHVVGGKMDQPMLLMALGLVMVKKKLMIKHGASGPEEPGDSHGAADGDGWRCSHGWWASENGEEAVPTAASSYRCSGWPAA